MLLASTAFTRIEEGMLCRTVLSRTSRGSMWMTNRFSAATGLISVKPASEIDAASSGNGCDVTTTAGRPSMACRSPRASDREVFPTPPLPQKTVRGTDKDDSLIRVDRYRDHLPGPSRPEFRRGA